ncbi:MAG: hypothetical protein ACLUI3_14255 [Christensenellales bacterium]
MVNTGGDHGDLTDDYAAIRKEMEAVQRTSASMAARGRAGDGGKPHRRGAQGCGDRAVLRALHYYDETPACSSRRRDSRRSARVLRRGEPQRREQLEAAANVYARPTEEQMAMGIELSRRFLHGDGAQRVHGGALPARFRRMCRSPVWPIKKLMEDAFGAGSCTALMVRPEGAVMMPMEAE